MKHRLDSGSRGAQALLIRHAPREPILKGDSVWQANLTPEGRAAALRFGKSLREFAMGGIFSSPVPRCADTAQLMLEGWGHAGVPVKEEWFLLSVYVEEQAEARAQYAAADPFQLLLDHVSGKPLAGFRSLEEGSRLLLSEISKRMVRNGLTVFVTHDAVLMPFRAHLLGDSFSKEAWLPFLGSATIVMDEAGLAVDGKRIDL